MTINSSTGGTTPFQVGTSTVDTSGTASIAPGVQVTPKDSIAKAGTTAVSNSNSPVPTSSSKPVLPTPTVAQETVVPSLVSTLTDLFVPNTTLVESLLAMASTMQEGASQSSTSRNLQDDNTPSDNTSDSVVITGSFDVNLQVALNNFGINNNLSVKELKDIVSAMKNNTDSSIPATAKQAAAQIIAQAAQQTQVENNLSTDWEPSQSEVTSALSSDQSSNVVTTGLVVAKELVGSISGQLQLLTPRGASNQATMTLLQSVSQAIITAQNTIYQLQQTNSEVARNEVKAQVEMQNLQLSVQEAQQQEAQKAMKKQHTLGVLMKIFGPIMKVLEVVMAAATGGIFGAAFAALDQQFNVMTKAIQGIGEVVSDIVNKMIPSNSPSAQKLKDAMNIMGQIGALAGLMMYGNLGGALMMLGGPNELINATTQLITTSGESGGMLADFCDMVGLSQQDAQYIAMGLTLAVTIGVVVASIAFQPGKAAMEAAEAAQEAAQIGAKIAEEATQKLLDAFPTLLSGVEKTDLLSSNVTTVIRKSEDLAQQLTNAIMKPLRSIAKSMQESKVFNAIQERVKQFSSDASNLQGQKIMAYTQDGLNAVQTGLGIANDVCSGLTSLSQAQLAKQKGKTDAEIAELQMMIKKLQQVLNTIISNMNGFTEDIKSLSDMYKNLLQGLNQNLQQIVAIRIS